MGAGGSPSSIEASYTLRGPIPAGNWNVVGDGIIVGSSAQSVTVRFEVRWRPQGRTDDSADTVLLSTTNTFNRSNAQPFFAIPYSASVLGIAADAVAGDLLVLRIAAVGGDPGGFFILNGEGKTSGGNIPRLDLPVVAK